MVDARSGEILYAKRRLEAHKPGVSLLDLCCGVAGPGRLMVAELGCYYLGVDYSAGALDTLRVPAGGATMDVGTYTVHMARLLGRAALEGARGLGQFGQLPRVQVELLLALDLLGQPGMQQAWHVGGLGDELGDDFRGQPVGVGGRVHLEPGGGQGNTGLVEAPQPVGVAHQRVLQ